MLHQTCKSSPSSDWHARCRLGPPWDPSEPPSNDEENGYDTGKEDRPLQARG